MIKDKVKTVLEFGLPALTVLEALRGRQVDGIQLVEGLLAGVAVLLGIQFISKISPPKALAMGYFYSFVMPVVERLKGCCKISQGGVVSEYSGGKLVIWFPSTLGLDANEPGGVQGTMTKKHNAGIEAQIVMGGGVRPFDVHVIPGDTPPVIIDVPGALNALRTIVLVSVPEPKQPQYAEKALKEFTSVLKKLILDAGYTSELVGVPPPEAGGK